MYMVGLLNQKICENKAKKSLFPLFYLFYNCLNKYDNKNLNVLGDQSILRFSPNVSKKTKKNQQQQQKLKIKKKPPTNK